MTTTINDVVRAIHQAANDAKDHPYGGKKTGALKREEGHKIVDSRVIDGFGVKIGGNILTINYHTECRMSEVNDGKFENVIQETINGLAKYLKKEYRTTTKETLKLKELDDIDIIIQETSRVRCWVQASQSYTIGNLEKPTDDTKPRKKIYDALDDVIEEGWQTFLALSRGPSE